MRILVLCALAAFAALGSCVPSSSNPGGAGPDAAVDGGSIPDGGATESGAGEDAAVDGGSIPDGGATESGVGEAGADAAVDGGLPCATDGWYMVQDSHQAPPAQGAALYRIAKSAGERDVYLGTLHGTDGNPYSGLEAVAAGPPLSGTLVGFNEATGAIPSAFLTIDLATLVVAGTYPWTNTTYPLSGVTALSYGGSAGIFVVALHTGPATVGGPIYCVNATANTVTGLSGIPLSDALVIHGTCSMDGTYDLYAIDAVGTGNTAHLVHVQKAAVGGKDTVLSSSADLGTQRVGGLLASNSVMPASFSGQTVGLYALLGPDAGATVIRTIDDARQGLDPSTECDHSKAPYDFAGFGYFAE
jgi:hypothetical protein